MDIRHLSSDFFGGLRKRDLEILAVLTTKVRFLSLRQIAETHFANDIANSIRRLDYLEERGILVSYRLNTRTPPPIDSPLVVWTPGQDQPNFTRLAYQLTKRWLRQGTRIRMCYFAGTKFEAITGVRCQSKPVHPLQASHDLGLAGLYLHFRCVRPNEAICWLGEHARSPVELKNQQPDAVLLDSMKEPVKAIEYGGLYNAKRLERFHRWCQQRSLPYEIW